MKKILIVLVGVTFMASCNRDSDSNMLSAQGGEVSSAEAGLVHFEASQLENDFTPMNGSTSVSGKTGEQLSFTFRGYADPVEIGGVDLAASAVFQIEDMIFVAWHTNDFAGMSGTSGTVSGSLCAYRLSGIGQYELMDRVDFEQHDLYALSAHRNVNTGNFEVMVTGQRNIDLSEYLLANHQGAVVARMDYDYINHEFWENSLTELPLLGVAGTGIVAVGSQYFVTTGNGIGADSYSGVFQVDRSLRNVIDVDYNITDAIDIVVDHTSLTKTSGTFFVLDRTSFTPTGSSSDASVLIKSFDYSVSVPGQLSFGGLIARNGDHDQNGTNWPYRPQTDIQTIDQAKGHLVIAQGKKSSNTTFSRDSLLINYGKNGGNTGIIYKATGGNDISGQIPTGVSIIDSSMSVGDFSAIAFDPILGVLYCGGNDNSSTTDYGLSVIAMKKFARDDKAVDTKPFVTAHDVVGILALPKTITQVDGSTKSLGDLDVNDITVYQSRHIALSLGDEGLMFIQRDY